MRRLMLMRHAKSDWDAPFDHDHERPLAPRGERAAARIGRFLTETGHTPELVVSSTAVRARRTVEIAADAGGWSCPIALEERLYEVDADRVLALVARTDRAISRLLVVGHEPTSSATIRALSGTAARFPTAAVACLSVDRDTWRRTAPGTAELRWLVTPKLLRGIVPDPR